MKSPTQKLTGTGLFHVEPDAHVIIREKGVFRQVSLYRRGTQGDLFCQYRTGYARLMRGGGTSVVTLLWDEVVGLPEGSLHCNDTGVMLRKES